MKKSTIKFESLPRGKGQAPVKGSDSCFNGPDESAEAEAGLSAVNGLKAFKEGFDAGVIDHRQHRFGERRPSMRAQVRLTGVRPAALHGSEGRVAPTGAGVQDFQNLFMMSLIIGYEYRLHRCIAD